MSKRRGPELSASQLVAGGLATATATVATSYLGVAGTIIGAAFMSIATTAGAAVYQHYLDRGRTRYVTLVAGEIRHRRTVPVTEPGEQERQEHQEQRQDQRQEQQAEQQPEEQPEEEPEEQAESHEPGPAGQEAAAATRGGRRPRWYVFAGAAAAIFAVVIGGITLVESLAHKPLSAIIGKTNGSGTSLGDAFGGRGNGPPPTPPPVVPSTSVGTTTPSVSGTPVPTPVPSQPTTEPIKPPVTTPTTKPPTSTTRPPGPTPSPTTPPPTP